MPSKLSKKIIKEVEKSRKRMMTFEASRVKQMTGMLKKASDDVAKEIARISPATAGPKWQTLRLKELKKIETKIASIGTELDAQLAKGSLARTTEVVEIGVKSAYNELKVAEKSFSPKGGQAKFVQGTFNVIDRDAIKFLANYDVQLAGSLSSQLVNDIKTTIGSNIATGGSYDEMVQQIGRVIPNENAFRKAGKTVFKTAQTRARVIARTETSRAFQEGKRVAYERAGVSLVEWFTAEDERVCPICNPLDGRRFTPEQLQKDGPPPRHIQCRCTCAPVPGEIMSRDFLDDKEISDLQGGILSNKELDQIEKA